MLAGFRRVRVLMIKKENHSEKCNTWELAGVGSADCDRCDTMVCITILVLAGFCFSQSAPPASSEVLTNWTEFHRPNMTRLIPFEKVLNVRSVRNLQRKWTYTAGDQVNSSPAQSNGRPRGADADNR